MLIQIGIIYVCFLYRTMSNVEDFITDVSQHSYQICGKLYSGDFTQIVKNNNDGTDLSLEHSFYTIDDNGVVKKLGGMTFAEKSTGTVSMNFNVVDSVTGQSAPVLEISPEGVAVSGGIDVSGGSTSFETTSIEVADYDIVLGSNAQKISDLDGGGIILGTAESGTKTILYSSSLEKWSCNTGVNVDTGYSFTVNSDSVVLGESGLIIGSGSGSESGSSILLSDSGLNIGDDVELNSESLQIGKENPVVLSSSGLVVGNSLSLSTSTGLQAGDIVLNSQSGLVIGTGLVLDGSGLYVGDQIELSTGTGLTLGNINVGTESLTLSNSESGDVVLDSSGCFVGQDASLSKGSGLVVGDVQVKSNGVYLPTAETSLFMGPQDRWKISVDSLSGNLKFEYLEDEVSGSYVVKMELKTT